MVSHDFDFLLTNMMQFQTYQHEWKQCWNAAVGQCLHRECCKITDLPLQAAVSQSEELYCQVTFLLVTYGHI